ncbi:MAG: hypothetical protein WD960_10130 [Gemmatimonadota bacterium]
MSRTTGYPTKRRVFGLGELIAVLIVLLASVFVLEDVRLGDLDCEVGSTLQASTPASPIDCEPVAPARFAER